MVPCYLLCSGYEYLLGLFRQTQQGMMFPELASRLGKLGWRVCAKTMFLGVICLAAFLAPRLPLKWRPEAQAMNDTEELMIKSNLLTPEMADWLGVKRPMYQGAAPVWQNYAHPLLFVGAFVPFIVFAWRRIDGRLKIVFLTLTPLLLLSNVCFGWMYESRNYVPLLPLLATMADLQAPGA